MRDAELLTIHEAARVLRVSPRTVRTMLADGRLTRVVVSVRCVRVRRVEVDAIVNPAPTTRGE